MSRETEKSAEKIRKGLKAKYFCMVLVIVFEIALVLVVWLVGHSARRKEKECTQPLDAVVLEESTRIVDQHHIDRTKHGVKTKVTAVIQVKTDGVFKQSIITVPTAKYERGQELKVFYDPDDPDDYYIEGDIETAFTTQKVIIVIAALWAIVCVILVRIVKKDVKKLKNTEK